jgi:hypothetical protein
MSHAAVNPVSLKRIFITWWPLSFSWLLMGLELPALSAVIARLPNAEINLAAYGGVVFPIALIIEAPVIMLLAASTALCKDRSTYRKLHKLMMVLGGILTIIHVLIAFTPLYDVIVVGLMGVPDEIVEPARAGLMLITPWTWAIAYRRFQQGVLIRFGHSSAVGVGTTIRLTSSGAVLLAGYLVGDIPGVMVGAGAQAFGVVCEAIYAGIRVQPVICHQLAQVQSEEPLTWRAFANFYIPLALTSLIFLIWQPIGAAAISRMPQAIASLAAWQVVSSLTFIMRSFGFSYNEVVVALIGETGAYAGLRRFTFILSAATICLHLLIAVTPLAMLWFSGVMALDIPLATISHTAFWLALPMPALSTLQSWYQGAILHSRKTRAVPESVLVFLGSVSIILIAGVLMAAFTGLYVAMAGFVLATIAQTAWLGYRSLRAMQAVMERDSNPYRQFR